MIDVFVHQSLKGEDMVCCSVIWQKPNLTFAEDIVLCKEAYESGVDDAAEQLPQITAHTDASVVVRV